MSLTVFCTKKDIFICYQGEESQVLNSNKEEKFSEYENRKIVMAVGS